MNDKRLDERKKLVENLKRKGYVRSKSVEIALLKVPRHKFIPPNIRGQAYVDSPQPIGNGQTISAPHMVAMMVEELNLEKGMKVLEVGGGRGYHAAVIAEVVGKEGEVYTIERIDNLSEYADKMLSKLGYNNVHVIKADGSKGYSEEAPFDRISVACGAREVPPPLLEQLKPGGILLIPIGKYFYQELTKITKSKDGEIKKERLGGVLFVPLQGEYS